jgi:hypothetical protein
MQFSNKIRISVPISLDNFDNQGIGIILTESGFRNITNENQSVHGARGSHFATLFNIGEPRRNFHKINIQPSTINYEINSLYGWFSSSDKAVYEEEAKIISDKINGKAINYSALKKITFKRRLTDAFLMLSLIALVLVVLYGL